MNMMKMRVQNQDLNNNDDKEKNKILKVTNMEGVKIRFKRV